MRPIALLPTLGLTALFLAPTHADDWPQWRGPQRNGVSAEKKLLQDWPKEGPKQSWHITNAGSGYSTPSVVGDTLFLIGNEGLENEFIAAFSTKDGHKLWSTRLGKVGNPNQKPNFPGSRSTPTVVGNQVYALGSDGDLVCLEKKDGAEKWRKNLRSDFGGKPGEWAYSESPLVFGETLVVTPGGTESTMVALNRKTGAVLWKFASPDADQAGYSSAMLAKAGGTEQCVQLLQKGLVGLNAKTGERLWNYTKPVSRYGANIPSPVVDGDFIYASAAGTGGGAVKLKTTGAKAEVEQLYFESKFPTAIGGAVKVGEFLYGTTQQSLMCAEFTTGKVRWEERAIGAASIGAADGRLYLHGENGEVALVEATAEGYREKGRFKPEGGPAHGNPMEKSWAYPVVANGNLIIRDHASVWCYDVSGRKAK